MRAGQDFRIRPDLAVWGDQRAGADAHPILQVDGAHVQGVAVKPVPAHIGFVLDGNVIANAHQARDTGLLMQVTVPSHAVAQQAVHHHGCRAAQNNIQVLVDEQPLGGPNAQVSQPATQVLAGFDAEAQKAHANGGLQHATGNREQQQPADNQRQHRWLGNPARVENRGQHPHHND